MSFVARVGHLIKRSMNSSKLRSRGCVMWGRAILIAWFMIAVYSYLSLYHEEGIKNYLDSVKGGFRTQGVNFPSDPARVYQKLRYDTEFQYSEPYTLQESLLTVHIGPDRGRKLESVEELAFYDADPRLSWSVHLDHWLEEAQDANSDLMMFSWYDWADFHNWNKLVSLVSTDISCDLLFEPYFNAEKLQEIESEIGEDLFRYNRPDYSDSQFKLSRDESVFKNMADYCQEEKPETTKDGVKKFSSGLKVVKQFDKTRPEVYEFHARNYMVSTLRNPMSVTIMNESSQPIQLYVNQTSRSNIAQSGLLSAFLDKHRKDAKTDMFNHTVYFKKFLESNLAKSHQVHIKELSEEERDAYNKQYFHLKPSDFEFDAIAKIAELENRQVSLSTHEAAYLDGLKYTTQTHYAFDPKHFIEAGGVKEFSSLGSHHDVRFFNGAIVKDSYDSQLKLNALIRTFQRFLKANGLISWLAHGTLYSYVYNGQTFPWDFDFDVQMPIRHLHILAQYFNQTLVMEDPRYGNGKYLIDIGSSITTRINGNGKNNIDARFVCVDSGLYIDITGLSVSSAMITQKFSKLFNSKKGSLGTDIVHRNPNLVENITDLSLQTLQVRIENDPQYSVADKELVKKLINKANDEYKKSPSLEKLYSAEQRYSFNHDLQIYNCRNNHFVSFDEISPLVLTEYHGVSTFVPPSYITILRREYRVPLKYGFISYRGNVFMPELRYWLSSSLLKTVSNKRQQNSDWDVINTSLNNLKINDVKSLYANLARSGESLALSILYNSREISTYRLKEIDIQFGSNSPEEKEQLLTNLRVSLGWKLQATFKDPYLYEIERRKWEDTIKEQPEMSSIATEIDREMASEMYKWTEALHDRKLAFYNSSSLNYNDVCEPTYVAGELSRNSVFSLDPVL